MSDNKKIVSKTIKIDQETVDKIIEMGKEAERDFSKQVRFILTEYITMKEKK